MRKFMKGCAITALIFILLGLILGVSGSLGNGSTHFSPGEILSAVTLGRISEEKVDDWSDGVTEQIRENMSDVHYDLEDKVDYDSDYEVKSGKIELYVLGDDSQGITDLQVQVGGCVMKIQVSEDNCFRVEADGMRKFQGYVEGGTMEICGTSKASNNSEGNLGIANAILQFLAQKLPVSRLQRDLTDSTVLRNIGVPLGHSVIAIQSTLKGLRKLILHEEKLQEDLNNTWAVVAEAIQTILRREAYPHPYEALKALTRTNQHMTEETIHEFIQGLNVSDSVKAELMAITPSNYTGI